MSPAHRDACLPCRLPSYPAVHWGLPAVGVTRRWGTEDRMGMGRAEVGQGCEGLKGRYQVWEEKRLRER